MMTPEKEQEYLNQLDVLPGTSSFNLPTEIIVSSDNLCIKAFTICDEPPDYLLKHLSPTRLKHVLSSINKYVAINSICFDTLPIESKQDPDIILSFCEPSIVITELTKLPQEILKDINFQKKCLYKDPSSYIFLPHQDLTTQDIFDIFQKNPFLESKNDKDDYLNGMFFEVISSSHPEFFNDMDIIKKTVPYLRKKDHPIYFFKISHHLKDNIDLVNLFFPHVPDVIYFVSEKIKEQLNLNLLPPRFIPHLPHKLKYNQEMAKKAIVFSKKDSLNKSLISTFPFEIQSEESNIELLLSLQKEKDIPIIKAIQNIYSLEDYEQFENKFSSITLDPLSKLIDFFIFLPKSTKSNLPLLNEIPDLMHPDNLVCFWKNLSSDIKNDPLISEEIVDTLSPQFSYKIDSFMSYLYHNGDSNLSDSDLLFSKIRELRENKEIIHFKWPLILNNSDMFTIYKSYLDQNDINHVSNVGNFLDKALISYESLKMYNNLGSELKPYNSKKGLKF